MRRRVELKSIGSGVLHSFVSRNNDLDGYWAIGKLYLYAKRAGDKTVSLDLISGEVLPSQEKLDRLYSAPDFDVITTRYSAMFLRSLSKHGVPLDWLTEASIRIEFERENVTPKLPLIGMDSKPYICELSITDDLRHVHKISTTGWCWPHNPAIELRSTRA